MWVYQQVTGLTLWRWTLRPGAARSSTGDTPGARDTSPAEEERGQSWQLIAQCSSLLNAQHCLMLTICSPVPPHSPAPWWSPSETDNKCENKNFHVYQSYFWNSTSGWWWASRRTASDLVSIGHFGLRCRDLVLRRHVEDRLLWTQFTEDDVLNRVLISLMSTTTLQWQLHVTVSVSSCYYIIWNIREGQSIVWMDEPGLIGSMELVWSGREGGI